MSLDGARNIDCLTSRRQYTGCNTERAVAGTGRTPRLSPPLMSVAPPMMFGATWWRSRPTGRRRSSLRPVARRLIAHRNESHDGIFRDLAPKDLQGNGGPQPLAQELSSISVLLQAYARNRRSRQSPQIVTAQSFTWSVCGGAVEEQDRSPDRVRLDQELALSADPLDPQELGASRRQGPGTAGNVKPVVARDSQLVVKELIDLFVEASVRTSDHEGLERAVPQRTLRLVAWHRGKLSGLQGAWSEAKLLAFSRFFRGQYRTRNLGMRSPEWIRRPGLAGQLRSIGRPQRRMR